MIEKEMENKIEVGEYVRLDRGGIKKVIGTMFKDSSSPMYVSNDNRCYYSNEIVKHSKNIIDLIEEGDYVNGKEVKHIAMFEGFPDYPKLIFVDEHRLLPDETCENNDIKSIVTKEQFASMKYKI